MTVNKAVFPARAPRRLQVLLITALETRSSGSSLPQNASSRPASRAPTCSRGQPWTP